MSVRGCCDTGWWLPPEPRRQGGGGGWGTPECSAGTQPKFSECPFPQIGAPGRKPQGGWSPASRNPPPSAVPFGPECSDKSCSGMQALNQSCPGTAFLGWRAQAGTLSGNIKNKDDTELRRECADSAFS